MATAILPLAKIAGGLLLGKTVAKGASSILGIDKKKAAPAPAPVEEGPRVMPLADDEAVRRSRKNSILQQRGRSGRASTMLTPDSETLGG
jgi:hypothetical protein